MDNESRSYTYGELLNYIDGICKKYQYDFEMTKLFRKLFPIIIDHYGNNYYKKIIRAFFNTPIIVTKKLDKKNLELIRDYFKQKTKPVTIEGEEFYSGNADPGSILGVEPIFDKQCNVTDEKKWIVAKDMRDTKYDELFMKYFDTTINVPFLIHEMCHVIGSLNTVYQKKDDKFYAKTGMVEELYSICKNENKFILKEVFSKYFVLEEAVNELDTREILAKLLKIPYDSVELVLSEIGNDNSNYTSSLITVAQELKSAIGRENLNRYRIDNDMNVKNNYNKHANESVIIKDVVKDKEPFDIMDFYATKLYELNCKRNDYDNISFEKLQNYYVFYSVLPSFAYKNVKGINGYTYDNYKNLKNSLLGDNIAKKTNSK